MSLHHPLLAFQWCCVTDNSGFFDQILDKRARYKLYRFRDAETENWTVLEHFLDLVSGRPLFRPGRPPRLDGYEYCREIVKLLQFMDTYDCPSLKGKVALDLQHYQNTSILGPVESFVLGSAVGGNVVCKTALERLV